MTASWHHNQRRVTHEWRNVCPTQSVISGENNNSSNQWRRKHRRHQNGKSRHRGISKHIVAWRALSGANYCILHGGGAWHQRRENRNNGEEIISVAKKSIWRSSGVKRNQRPCINEAVAKAKMSIIKGITASVAKKSVAKMKKT